jgi:hypothetical protein
MARPYQKQADPDLAIQLLDHAISRCVAYSDQHQSFPCIDEYGLAARPVQNLGRLGTTAAMRHFELLDFTSYTRERLAPNR